MQHDDQPIETSEAEARPYAAGAPENIRAGDPYDDPEFERLAREHDVWGRADSALCAVFWLAGKAQPSGGQSAATVSGDAQAIRDAALEEAAKVPRAYADELDRMGWGKRFPDELTAIFNASTNMSDRILALKGNSHE